MCIKKKSLKWAHIILGVLINTGRPVLFQRSVRRRVYFDWNRLEFSVRVPVRVLGKSKYRFRFIDDSI